MRAVNLLPRDEPKKSFEAKRGVVFGAGGGAALVTVGLTALMLSAGGKVTELQGRIDTAKAELAALPATPEAPQDAAADATLAAELQSRTSALSTALAGRVAWDNVLRQVSQVLPDDVWLTALQSASAEASDADPNAEVPTGVTLAGATYAQSGVARLLSRLAVVPALANVRLQSSVTAESGSSSLVQFTIIADVRSGGSQ